MGRRLSLDRFSEQRLFLHGGSSAAQDSKLWHASHDRQFWKWEIVNPDDPDQNNRKNYEIIVLSSVLD
ncbi:hypothetical protein TNCV_1809861 [Trichonephila clavipes]|nr:hypothetical protein TNCV_1809861 [Trichonephila clavipes]